MLSPQEPAHAAGPRLELTAPATQGGWLRSALLDSPLTTFASLSIVLLLGLAVLGPLLWRQDPTAINLEHALQAPTRAHPMGTDDVGRDIFARFNKGAQLSLAVGLVAALSGALIGGLLGIIGGTLGGLFDLSVMRVMDALLAFPPLILIMAVTLGLGVGVRSATIGIVITTVPWYARLVRSDALSIRGRQFIEATRALGATRQRLVFRHVIPHAMPTLLVQGAHAFGYAILSLAALGFIGLGAQPPTPEWGVMVTEGLAYAITGQWWIGVFPGIGVLLAVTAANIYADRIRELLDPRNTKGGGRTRWRATHSPGL